MKRVAALWALSSLAILLVAAPCATSAGVVRQYKVPNRFPEDLPPSKLSVYLPEGYDTSGEAYPVLYLVHGDGGNGMTFLGGGYGGTLMVDANAAAIVDGLVSGGKVRPLIVACPDMNGAASSPDELLRDVVAFVDANFRTIPRRDSRAVAGHSTGGMVSLVTALKNPDMFSVAGGLSAYLPGSYLTRLRDLAKKPDQGKLPLRILAVCGNERRGGAGPVGQGARRNPEGISRARGIPRGRWGPRQQGRPETGRLHRVLVQLHEDGRQSRRSSGRRRKRQESNLPLQH